MEDSVTEANSHFRQIQCDEIITKLAHDIVARGLPIRNLHERRPEL
jgi:hypothetical protein